MTNEFSLLRMLASLQCMNMLVLLKFDTNTLPQVFRILAMLMWDSHKLPLCHCHNCTDVLPCI